MTGADKILLGFVGYLALTAFGLHLVEPDMATYIDALWYCFAVVTTIGFGDLVAVTLVGRAMTVVLGLYGILVVAIIPGVVVSYFTEVSQMKAKASVTAFLEKLEDLPNLPKTELEALSQTIKNRRYKL